MNKHKPPHSTNWKQKLVHEMQTLWVLSLVIFLFLCALSLYKNLIIGESNIIALQYWYLFAEALLLAKILYIGKFLKLGERFLDKPLIVPTLYKTFVFCSFVVFFAIVEHFVIGLLSGTGITTLYKTFTRYHIKRIIGEVPIFFAMTFPFICLLELGRVLGTGKLLSLFFKKGSHPSNGDET